MPNILNDLGLEIKTKQEIIDELNTSFRNIYGSDINLDSDSPDGQAIGIYSQGIVDTLELLLNIYNSFDPDQATGVVLNQRCAINGIQRQEGTYTITNIDVTFTEAATIQGLNDVEAEDAYTVADDEGNEWKLITTYSAASSGTFTLAFRAAETGARTTIPNTITVPVTIVLAVSSVNNPTTYTTLGIDEESDADLKTRRRRSVSLPAQGYFESLKANLENLTGVISALVYENRTGAPDQESITSEYPNGTPSHCIWVIVDGTASEEDIATVIYRQRNAGANMRGTESYTITQVDGSPFEVLFDYADETDLFIKFNVASLNGVQDPNYEALREQIPQLFVPRVFEKVNVNDLVTVIQQIDSNTLATDLGFSETVDGSYTNTLQPDVRSEKFTVTSENIVILPILILPKSATVEATGEKKFKALGGYGDYTWTLTQDESGGNINNNGEYTAGASAGTDIAQVQDEEGNTQDVTITVV